MSGAMFGKAARSTWAAGGTENNRRFFLQFSAVWLISSFELDY
jgi:hypothetical protein